MRQRRAGADTRFSHLPPLAGEVPAPAEAPWRRRAAGDGGLVYVAYEFFEFNAKGSGRSAPSWFNSTGDKSFSPEVPLKP